MTRLVVVSAGVSVPSSTRILADSLARAAELALERSESAGVPGSTVQTTIVELRELAHPIADALLTGFAAGALADALGALAEADAVIAVSPVYAGSYSGLFKLFLDVVEDGTLEGVPVLLAATAGTARHSLVLDFAMRPLFAHLRADVVPTAVFAASEDFGAGSLRGGSLSERVTRAAGELADAVRRGRRSAPRDPFETPTPFEELLDGLR